MPAPTLKDRVAALEAELLLLRLKVDKHSKNGWRAFVGAFRGDPVFKRAMEYGRKYRESLRPKTRVKRKKADGRS